MSLSLVDTLHQLAAAPTRSDECKELLVLLWGDHQRPRFSDLQRSARTQLETVLRLAQLRVLRRILSLLPSLDRLDTMTNTEALQWIHAAAGGSIGDYPVVIQCTTETQRTNVLSGLASAYPALTLETPEEMRPAVWAATTEAQERYGDLSGSDPVTLSAAQDYAAWRNTKVGVLVRALVKVAQVRDAIEARVEELT